jgi:CHAD domain-containing protein
MLAAQAAVLRWNEPGARLGLDTEALHAVRVASRRMLASLDALGRALRKRPRKKLRRAIRALVKATGKARDLDVQLADLRARVDPLPPEDRAHFEPIEERLSAHRDRLQRRVAAWFGGGEWATLAQRLARAAERLDHGHPTRFGWRSAEEVAKLRIADPLDRVLGMGRKLDPGSAPRDFHRLRLACKDLRYTAELLLPLDRKAFTPLIDHMVALQALLGEHQDACVAQELLSADDSDTALRLVAAQAERARELRERFPAVWAELDQPAVVGVFDPM